MPESTHRAKRISVGHYAYRGFFLRNCGYHHPDHCVWWEATDETGAACFHATTKRAIMRMIDEDLEREVADAGC